MHGGGIHGGGVPGTGAPGIGALGFGVPGNGAPGNGANRSFGAVRPGHAEAQQNRGMCDDEVEPQGMRQQEYRPPPAAAGPSTPNIYGHGRQNPGAPTGYAGQAGQQRDNGGPYAQPNQTPYAQQMNVKPDVNAMFGGAAQPTAHEAIFPNNPYMGQPGQAYMIGQAEAMRHAPGMPAAARSPVVRSRDAPFLPLRELSCYNNKWMIKARVTVKSDRRKFTNQRGEGQLFSADLLDESGETRATFFGKAVDIWYDSLIPGKVYTFSKGTVKAANRKFYSKSEYEITFDENAAIQQMEESDVSNIPQLQYDFIPIKTIGTLEINTIVDVKGIIVHANDSVTLNLKNGKDTRKRSIFVADESDTKCEFTIWGDRSDSDDIEVGMAIFIKNARVGEFNGKNLSTQSSTYFEVAPGDRRAFDLKEWYDGGGNSAVFSSLSNSSGSSRGRKTFEEMNEEDVVLGVDVAGKNNNLKTVHFHEVAPAYFTYIVQDQAPFYLACPHTHNFTDKDGRVVQRPCNKKAEKIPDKELYACGNTHNFERPVARYVVRVKIQDCTTQVDATVFDEVGRKLFQAEANDMWQLWERRDNDPQAALQLGELFGRAYFTRWSMKIKSNKEKYQEEDRLKRTITDITALNNLDEATRNIELIERKA